MWSVFVVLLPIGDVFSRLWGDENSASFRHLSLKLSLKLLSKKCKELLDAICGIALFSLVLPPVFGLIYS